MWVKCSSNVGTLRMLANDAVCQFAYGLLSCISSYGSIRTALFVSCSTRQFVVLTRASEGKAEEIVGTLEHDLASRSIVDS